MLGHGHHLLVPTQTLQTPGRKACGWLDATPSRRDLQSQVSRAFARYDTRTDNSSPACSAVDQRTRPLVGMFNDA